MGPGAHTPAGIGIREGSRGGGSGIVVRTCPWRVIGEGTRGGDPRAGGGHRGQMGRGPRWSEGEWGWSGAEALCGVRGPSAGLGGGKAAPWYHGVLGPVTCLPVAEPPPVGGRTGAPRLPAAVWAKSGQ